MDSLVYKKISEIINKSNLPKDEIEELLFIFSKANENELEDVFALLSDSKSWIEIINNNYKAKKSALASNNTTMWEEILKGEEVTLENL